MILPYVSPNGIPTSLEPKLARQISADCKSTYITSAPNATIIPQTDIDCNPQDMQSPPGNDRDPESHSGIFHFTLKTILLTSMVIHTWCYMSSIPGKNHPLDLLLLVQGLLDGVIQGSDGLRKVYYEYSPGFPRLLATPLQMLQEVPSLQVHCAPRAALSTLQNWHWGPGAFLACA